MHFTTSIRLISGVALSVRRAGVCDEDVVSRNCFCNYFGYWFSH